MRFQFSFSRTSPGPIPFKALGSDVKPTAPSLVGLDYACSLQYKGARRMALALEAPATAAIDTDLYALDKESGLWFLCKQASTVQLLEGQIVYADLPFLLGISTEPSVIDVAVVAKNTPTSPAGNYTIYVGLGFLCLVSNGLLWLLSLMC